MQLLRTDRYLSAQSELCAIGKAGAGIDIDRGRIHFIDEVLCVFEAAAKDPVGMLGAMFTNMRDGVIQRSYRFDIQFQRQPFIILLTGCNRLHIRLITA